MIDSQTDIQCDLSYWFFPLTDK